MIRDAPAHPWLQSVRSATSGPRERKASLATAREQNGQTAGGSKAS